MKEGIFAKNQVTSRLYVKLRQFLIGAGIADKEAVLQLGHLYQISAGEIRSDKEQAFDCYMQAAQLRHPDALAPLERLGEEVDVSRQQALSQLYRLFRDPEKERYWRTLSEEAVMPDEFGAGLYCSRMSSQGWHK